MRVSWGQYMTLQPASVPWTSSLINRSRRAKRQLLNIGRAFSTRAHQGQSFAGSLRVALIASIFESSFIRIAGQAAYGGRYGTVTAAKLFQRKKSLPTVKALSNATSELWKTQSSDFIGNGPRNAPRDAGFARSFGPPPARSARGRRESRVVKNGASRLCWSRAQLGRYGDGSPFVANEPEGDIPLETKRPNPHRRRSEAAFFRIASSGSDL